MGKPKLTPLAVALKAIEPLSDEEKQTVRDMLRPAPKPRSKPKPERKPAQKRKAGKEATTVGTISDVLSYGQCAKPGCELLIDENVHQLKTDPRYHEFVEPAGEAKGVGV